MAELRVEYDESAQRYEIREGDTVAGFAEAPEQGDVVVMPHTVVDPAFGGRGVGSRLVSFALDDLRARGKQVDPQCPFVAAFIAKNPQYADLSVR